MEKGALHDMLGGVRFQTAVTITFFSLLSAIIVCCGLLLFSSYVVFAKM